MSDAIRSSKMRCLRPGVRRGRGLPGLRHFRPVAGPAGGDAVRLRLFRPTGPKTERSATSRATRSPTTASGSANLLIGMAKQGQPAAGQRPRDVGRQCWSCQTSLAVPQEQCPNCGAPVKLPQVRSLRYWVFVEPSDQGALRRRPTAAVAGPRLHERTPSRRSPRCEIGWRRIG